MQRESVSRTIKTIIADNSRTVFPYGDIWTYYINRIINTSVGMPFLPRNIEHKLVSEYALPSSMPTIWHGNTIKSAMMNTLKMLRLWSIEEAVHIVTHGLFAFHTASVHYQPHTYELSCLVESVLSWNQWKALHTKTRIVIFPGLILCRTRGSENFSCNLVSKSTTFDTLMTSDWPLVMVDLGRALNG
jgi:hypothetical protein